MNIVRIAIRFLRFLSLDIVAGALAISFYACDFLDVNLPAAYWLSLSLTVWIVYLADHLADSYINKTISSPRLIFLRKYRILIWFLFLINSFLLIGMLFILPHQLLIFGLLGGILVIFYLIINQFQSKLNIFILPRELVVAILYIYGVWGFPVLVSGFDLNVKLLIIILAWLLIILSNVLIYSYHDFKNDLKSNVQSLSVKLNPGVARKLSVICSALSTLFFIILFILDQSTLKFDLIGLIVSVGHAQIMLFPVHYKRNDNYGMIADSLLLLPYILLIV